MVRRTSLQSYNEIKENGLLSKRRFEVYSALFEHGPCTGSELTKKMGNMKNVVSQNVRARLNELRDHGCAIELGERVCSVSGQTVILWDITPSLPRPLKKKKRIKCEQCNGTGTILVDEENQCLLF